MLTEIKFAQRLKFIQSTIKNEWRMRVEQGKTYAACTLDFDNGVLKHRVDIRDIAVWNDHKKH
ncbi:hypothetical protein EV681_3591 [Advenella incenata]|jgi:hypothetical protein|uniref:Uncharacterized protein n=1 Tax=Advenella incenata TaxID=267800 RepID=A0A4Q7VB59_9BURK|nr:hypothetical protein [Advenella incenata]RZT92830.1 hypothetical protein EV681_3591 [Advenella incenata]